MNRRLIPYITIVNFIAVLLLPFIAIAATDAPHNASNNIDCGSCHGVGLLNSPFWGGTMSYDQLCLNCHTASSGPYSETNAPLVVTHSSDTTSDKYGEWSRECRNCHNPHYQRQKLYKNTDANNLYLATGTITNCIYNGDNTSTLTYSTITYKTGWDAAKLTEKTSEYRHTILFPNVNKLGYNYPIVEIDTDAKTIKVTGNVTKILYPPTTFAAIYGQYIKDVIDVGGTSKQVKFLDRKGANSYADGDTTYNGVCEVCHIQTMYHKNDGTGNYHYPAARCYVCHAHINGFSYAHGEPGKDCEDCHGHDDGWNGGSYYGTTQSHSTHTENDSDDLKGPNIACGDCHDPNNFPYFKSGTDGNADGKIDLSETDVCNNCHSPGGSFNGVSTAGQSIGAKDNWSNGVYTGNALVSGKEKWCAGCHDDQPAASGPPHVQVIVDDPAATFAPGISSWNLYSVPSQHYGTGFRAKPVGTGSGTATWTPSLIEAGQYSVYAWWVDNTEPYRAHDVKYTIHSLQGDETVTVDQTTGGGNWHLLGTWEFSAGTSGYVRLSDLATDTPGGTSYVVADAVRFVKGQPAPEVIDAPNVIGDNTTYGFYVTGHKINCLLCHDSEKRHIDRKHRTYEFNETTLAVVNDYNAGYRLVNGAMVMPRPGPSTGITPNDFALCLSCHNQNEVLGQNLSGLDYSHTNFWDSEYTITFIYNAHNYHIKISNVIFDSDWDGVADSRCSCVACHNVHGSPNQAMIRHGELISTPGTTDKVPALNFGYLVPPSGPPATATFTADSLQAGNYNVYAWWVDNDPQYRATDAMYTVYYSGGSDAVVVDQSTNGPGGGKWNLLGTYSYNAGATGTVILDNDYASSGSVVVADAVRWEKVGGGHEVIVDNTQATFVNDQSVWKTNSTEPQRYGADCRYIQSHSIPVADPDATLAESLGGWMKHGAGNVAGTKVCSTCHSEQDAKYIRAPNLWPKVIGTSGAVPKTVTNDGTGSTMITVTISDPDNNVTGVTIDLSPVGGSSSQAMTDNGDGTYSYLLTIDAGIPDTPYTFQVTATDADANTGRGQVVLLVVDPTAGTIYLDNVEAVFTEVWSYYSGHPQEFAGGFRYTAAGTGSATAVWTPTIPVAGQYEVYAWWVDNAPAYRASNAPYTIFYDGGSQTVRVDQSTNGPGGGKWNLLGTYTFAAGTSGFVQLSDDANNYVVADAIKLVPLP
jgi:hypothetical protein